MPLLEHTATSGPAFTVAAGAIVMCMAPLTAPHGPAGSFVVSVSVTLPAAISAALGVYVAFSVEAFGLNVPAPPLHMALEAPPPITPASCTLGFDAHTVRSAPATTVAAGRIVIFTWSLTWGQVPPIGALVSVSVTAPAAISAAVGV